ncbi:hypothetical protein SASPL_151453 [Salvia splendens]|uniref:HSP20 family protein n=1 Tax=Salvia splendens TaxID=180675 RepID=A0A8X8W7Z6_SALSN|nr:uncharacterized protein LOC121781299 [Salvia splendens]KAG6389977.1 hypothetical protein SASPL_151453 [Salvia splendens]
MEKVVRNLEKKDSSLMFREISPPHKWDQDLDFHYLRLTLPGFISSDVTLHMDKYGHLVVRGSHKITENKYLSFEETFDVPDGAGLELAEGIFEDEQIYCVTIPKSNELGQRVGPGGSGSGSESKRVKFDDQDQNRYKKNDLNERPRPSSVIETQNSSMEKIAFLIAILVAIYVAWLNR